MGLSPEGWISIQDRHDAGHPTHEAAPATAVTASHVLTKKPAEADQKSIPLQSLIEKILWKHYDPDDAPNMEEVAGEIVTLIHTDAGPTKAGPSRTHISIPPDIQSGDKWIRCGGKCVCCDMAAPFIAQQIADQKPRWKEEGRKEEREKAVGSRIEGEELAYERGRTQLKTQVIEIIGELQEKNPYGLGYKLALTDITSLVEKL